MIGLFDSGSGGLTVLLAIRQKAPRADITYFGDIANAPYGLKSSSELLRLTLEGVEFLASKGVTQLVSACNSISSSVLAGAAGELPFIEMSRPTSSYLKKFPDKRLLLIATPATVEAALYEKALRGIAALDSLAVPELASAIEFGSSQDEIEDILQTAFSSRKESKYDGLILGCTHYPLVLDSIQKLAFDYFGNIEIIDPAYQVAEEVCTTFDTTGSGNLRFFVSKESSSFRERVSNLFPTEKYTIEVVGG